MKDFIKIWPQILASQIWHLFSELPADITIDGRQTLPKAREKAVKAHAPMTTDPVLTVTCQQQQVLTMTLLASQWRFQAAKNLEQIP